jgi:hypothetical protein
MAAFLASEVAEGSGPDWVPPDLGKFSDLRVSGLRRDLGRNAAGHLRPGHQTAFL